jgi:cytochrome c peroxidase
VKLAPVVTSDPGRGLINGDVREFGRFDVPTLFGISKTEPYFHDNSAATLEQVIDHYQALFKFPQFADESQGLFAPGLTARVATGVIAAFRQSRSR